MNRIVYLHIGYPKAGSTTLQRHYFSKLKDIRYLGRKNGLRGESNLGPLNRFIATISFGSEEYCSKNYQIFNDFLNDEETRQFGNIDTSYPLFISHETITRLLFDPFYYLSYGYYTADANRTFKRLAEFASLYGYHFKIILIKRDPKTFLHSLYAQLFNYYKNKPKINTLNKYLEQILRFGELDQFNTTLLFNNKLQNIIASYFPEEDINVSDFEMLFSNDKSFNEFFEPIFNQRLSTFTVNITENQRTLDPKSKYAHPKPWWEDKKSFFQALKLACQAFRYHFFSSERQKIIVKRDEESEKLLQQIEDYFGS
ncbi:MAG: hypothetical protein JW866_10200 [Ignavibacteriales bacterium]|nr:hypothetical protein [Ignavibacteriales bacterium]